MAKIELALITNFDKERYIYIVPKLDELESYLKSNGHTVLRNEPGWQPTMRAAEAGTTARQIIAYWALNRQWCKYRKIAAPFILSDLVTLGKDLVNGTFNEARQRRAYRDMTVPANHRIAWKVAVDSGVDYCVVFEDDVVFKDDSMERLESAIQCIPNLPSNPMVYIDLAGGLPKEYLKVHKLEEGKGMSCTYYHKPVTNTARCYLINKQLVRFFVEQYHKDRNLTLLGADFLINALFLKLAREDLWMTFCVHTEPTVFKHGSFTGEYKAL